ncbi:uncharacterized protein BT62DRAFT_931799 [Guyanagaster necrorhizus]|uniref:Zinc-finger domain-containing protein n=1 Tax=Guyanagaster necrorhizus TaxID=856835 RepID=A0A9P7VSZ0_9AGAR|nr:uncharacterized protein BT62DRAFT_931799 [Guyanagaster necrorhizus MCA 3950]KAG7446349.1 hypothetical protein BT62DRAFT_931799 [Guyanagaster necrorhizus MCA 3950]
MELTPASSARHFMKVHVEIPPSPLRLYHRPTFASPLPTTSSCIKENTALSRIPSNNIVSLNYTMKRKADDQETAGSAKKAKSIPTGAPGVYCHQCNKKRDPIDCLQCTSTQTRAGQAASRRCSVKFCRTCLKNRYNEDLDTLKLSDGSVGKEGHTKEASYVFKCYKCRDICNCSRCRKVKGLAPIGNQLHIARKEDSKSLGPTIAKAISSANNDSGRPTTAEARTTTVKKTKKRVTPSLAWTSIKSNLSAVDAEARIFIREFVLRFAQSTGSGISKAHLEEMAHIGGSGCASEDDELVEWISEPAVKSILLWLLGLLSSEECDGAIVKLIKVCYKDIRGSGANLNKMWDILAVLRHSIENIKHTVFIPDPLPCPDSAVTHNTRSARGSNRPYNSIFIASSAQLVPIVLSLVEAVLQTQAIRAEIEDGVKLGKDQTREKQEAVRKEHERWEGMKGSADGKKGFEVQELRLKRREHKEIIENLDRALKVASHDFSLRSGPLGTDGDGRIYWALSPGVNDRQYAMQLVSAMAAGTKKPKKRRGCTRAGKDGSSLLDWSSFIAVWGQKPKTGMLLTHEDDSAEDTEMDQWWGFSDPEDIRKLADWLSIVSGLEEDGSESPSTVNDAVRNGNSVKALVHNLKDYATVLAWRCKDEIE